VRDAEAMQHLPYDGAPPPNHAKVCQPNMDPHDQALLLAAANLFHLRVTNMGDGVRDTLSITCRR
jgi:hypothetical protein